MQMNSQTQILNFLKQLQENNHKDWMTENKSVYQEAKKVFEEIVEKIIQEITTFDKDIADLSPKKCIFRLNRDIRFSKDKTPYKTNFGASMQKNGKKSPFSGYYLHIQPEHKSFLAAGIYMPTSDVLKKVRQEIDYNLQEFEEIITDTTFKKYFEEIRGEKLKSNPRGYKIDNPAIEFLKMKSFTIIHNLSDEEIEHKNFLQNIIPIYLNF